MSLHQYVKVIRVGTLRTLKKKMKSVSSRHLDSESHNFFLSLRNSTVKRFIKNVCTHNLCHFNQYINQIDFMQCRRSPFILSYGFGKEYQHVGYNSIPVAYVLATVEIGTIPIMLLSRKLTCSLNFFFKH